MKVKEAVEICGTLSNTSKMPGWSINLPATRCKAGSHLAQTPGSICHGCYALKGRYLFPNVKNAMERRYQGIFHPQWVEALSALIQKKVTKEVPYFRFFDSGDLQSEEHLEKIFQVCENNPDVYFWLPTREHKMVKNVARTRKVPDNLTIRVSATMIDGDPPSYWPTTATVVTTGATCPAYNQGGECGDCRACWDKSVPNVSYPKH